MKNSFERIAIVTGAAGGIGQSISEKIIHNVEKIILIDINKKKLDELRDALEKKGAGSLHVICCDVGDIVSVEKEIKNICNKIGLPNILINNAGIGGPFHRVDEVSDDEWNLIINTNLKSIFNFSKFLLPVMKKQKFGKIINIASVYGQFSSPFSSTYVVSKHGVIGYTKSIASEWGQHGIVCNAICPGYVDTTMGVQDKKIKNHFKKVTSKTPVGRIAQPHEVADLVNYLISDQASFINGSIITIDGGLTSNIGVL